MLLEEIKKYKIYLASQSPRRRELLAGMGFDFEVMPTHVKEVHPEGCTPAQLVEHLSRLKLSAVKLEDFPENALFIACDTVVVLDDEVLEKPENEDDAFRMLRSLSGREHVVMSGVTVKTRRYCATRHSETRVRFRAFSVRQSRRLWHPGVDRLCGDGGHGRLVLQRDGLADRCVVGYAARCCSRII